MTSASTPSAEAPQLSPAPHRDLVGEGIVLRPWRFDDAPALMAMAADPLIATWNPLDAKTLEDAKAWITKMGDWTDFGTWAIHDDTTDAILGSISLFHLDAKNSSGEIGYTIGPNARGRGVAARAIAAVGNFAFDELKVVRLEIFHAIENERSCSAATKAGFRLEGTLRKSFRYADGLLHDEHIHGRLSDD